MVVCFSASFRIAGSPGRSSGKGFQKLFAAAELAQLQPEERKDYEDSLKYYGDMKNVVDTSKEEGRVEGIIEVAMNLKKNNVPMDVIIQSTGLTREEIEKL